MVCKQCGAELADNQTECEFCGMPQQSEPTHQMSEPSVQADDTASRKKRPIVPIALALVVLAAGIFLVVRFFLAPSPTLLAGKAMVQLGQELTVRLNEAPLSALGKFATFAQDGQGQVHAKLMGADGFFAIATLGWQADRVTGGVALAARLAYDNKEIPVELHLNPERVALHSPLVSEEYYGFRFETFRTEFSALATMLGLSDESVDELAVVVEAVGRQLAQAHGTQLGEDYTRVLTSFVSGLKPTAEKRTETVGGRALSGTAIAYAVTGEQINTLMHDMGVQAWFPAFDMPGEQYAVTLLVDGAGRLSALTVDQTDEGVERLLTLDLGTSVHDPWTLTIPDNDLVLHWTYAEDGGRTYNTLTADVGGGYTTLSLQTIWSETGIFVVTYTDGDDTVGINGTLTTLNDGVQLQLGEVELDSELRLSDLRIAGGPRDQDTAFPDPTYTSIGTLTEAFILSLSGLLIYLHT